MSVLTIRDEPRNVAVCDKPAAVPALVPSDAAAATGRPGPFHRSARRRFSATRLAQPVDDGFHMFRIY